MRVMRKERTKQKKKRKKTKRLYLAAATSRGLRQTLLFPLSALMGSPVASTAFFYLFFLAFLPAPPTFQNIWCGRAGKWEREKERKVVVGRIERIKRRKMQARTKPAEQRGRVIRLWCPRDEMQAGDMFIDASIQLFGMPALQRAELKEGWRRWIQMAGGRPLPWPRGPPHQRYLLVMTARLSTALMKMTSNSPAGHAVLIVFSSLEKWRGARQRRVDERVREREGNRAEGICGFYQKWH